jgi:hypothetical protein
VIGADGHNKVRLTHTAASDIDPSWELKYRERSRNSTPAASVFVQAGAVVPVGVLDHGGAPTRCLTRQGGGRICPRNLSPELAARTANGRKPRDDAIFGGDARPRRLPSPSLTRRWSRVS